MPATQQVEVLNFGTGRLFALPPGGNRIPYGKMADISVDIKVDLKEIYGEGGFPIAVADAHRSIDVTGKHYTLSLDTIATDLGLVAPVASTTAISYDEVGTIVTHAYQLSQHATYVVGTAIVYVGAIRYKIVTAGSEVAGSACSITSGTVTFSASDTATTCSVTYAYTDASGTSITLLNNFQNSATPYQLVCSKRDISPIDGSVGQLIATFNAARAGGIKLDWKEGDWTTYERTFKCYADVNGIVGTLQFVNTTTSNAP
jgi:hypothetical protein